MIATCRTDGCPNAGAGIEVGDLSYVDDEGVDQISQVQCGVCGQPIDDVTGA